MWEMSHFSRTQAISRTEPSLMSVHEDVPQPVSSHQLQPQNTVPQLCGPRIQCRSSAAPECNAPARARGRGSPGAVANMCSGVSTQTEARGGSQMLLPTGDTACSFSTQSRSDANCFKVTAPHSKARQGKKYILCSECLGNIWLVVTCPLF